MIFICRWLCVFTRSETAIKIFHSRASCSLQMHLILQMKCFEGDTLWEYILWISFYALVAIWSRNLIDLLTQCAESAAAAERMRVQHSRKLARLRQKLGLNWKDGIPQIAVTNPPIHRKLNLPSDLMQWQSYQVKTVLEQSWVKIAILDLDIQHHHCTGDLDLLGKKDH